MSHHHHRDRTLSNAEKAVIVGLFRQCQNVIMIMGIMELRQETVENVLETYFGKKMSEFS